MNKYRTNYKKLNANFMNKKNYEVQIYICMYIFIKCSWNGHENCSKVNSYDSNGENIFSFLALQYVPDNHCVISTNSHFDNAHHIHYSGIPTNWGAAFFDNKHNLKNPSLNKQK
jgi:hypothetical protein